MQKAYIAKFNIGFARYPPDDPRMADYVNNFDVVCKTVDSQEDIIRRPPNPREEGHINGIESFWNQTKRHMCKFNGVPKP